MTRLISSEDLVGVLYASTAATLRVAHRFADHAGVDALGHLLADETSAAHAVEAIGELVLAAPDAHALTDEQINGAVGELLSLLPGPVKS